MAHLTRPAEISGVSAGSFPETAAGNRAYSIRRHVKCYFILHVKCMGYFIRDVKCMRYLFHHVKCMRYLIRHVKCMVT